MVNPNLFGDPRTRLKEVRMTKRKRQEQKREQQRLMRIRIMTSLAVMVAVVALGFVGIWWVGRQAGTTVDVEPLPVAISVEDAKALYDDGALIVDVRTAEEYESFHIPDTLSIPLDELEEQLEFIPISLDIIVVCRTGNRSSAGRDILLDAGFPRVTSMQGGVVHWAEAGYPLEGEDVPSDG